MPEPRDGGYAEDAHGDVWHAAGGSSVWRCLTAPDVPPMTWRSLVGTLGPLDVFVWRGREQ